MAKLTNIHGLPQPFINLFERETYSKGAARLSVTELINSPRIGVLRHLHGHKVTEDVVDKFWALMGTNIHRILELGGDSEHLTEERLFKEVDGWVVSGGIDLQKTKNGAVHIIDWKFVSVMSAMAAKPEWEMQLNSYAWLVREVKGAKVEKLQICAILRDWQKSKTTYDKSYPATPVIMLDIPLWSPDKARDFIADRVRLHKEAHRANDWGEDLPECTEEDMWVREGKYAVVKDGSTRAKRVFGSEGEAMAYVESLGPAKDVGLSVVRRPGQPIRCDNNYCGVAPWCTQKNKQEPEE